MPENPMCLSCRFWSSLRPRAVIGRCRNPDSKSAFPRPTFCCSLWEAEQRSEERPTEPQRQPTRPGFDKRRH